MFDQAVARGRSANPDPPTGTKKTFARQLVDRLARRRDDILRFLHDLTVPFTNNQAEQDIRMAKVQMKVSGSWRTLDSANHWLLVRSHLSTARNTATTPSPSSTTSSPETPGYHPPTPNQTPEQSPR